MRNESIWRPLNWKKTGIHYYLCYFCVLDYPSSKHIFSSFFHHSSYNKWMKYLRQRILHSTVDVFVLQLRYKLFIYFVINFRNFTAWHYDIWMISRKILLLNVQCFLIIRECFNVLAHITISWTDVVIWSCYI